VSRTGTSTSAARQRRYRERKRHGVIRATAEIGREACDLFVQLGYGPRSNPPAVRTALDRFLQRARHEEFTD
jgi:hypothetical protein